jgi:hypothetical protein
MVFIRAAMLSQQAQLAEEKCRLLQMQNQR